MGGGWGHGLFAPFPCLEPLPQGTRGAWSAASGSVRPGHGTVFFVLDKSAEALGQPGGCWFSGRLRCQGVGERGRFTASRASGDGAVRTAEVVGAAAAETVPVPGSTRQPAAGGPSPHRVPNRVRCRRVGRAGVFLEVLSLLVLGGVE